MSGPGQPQCLRALAHAHVQQPQPPAHREAAGDLLVELPCHQFLAHRVAKAAETLQPEIRTTGEAGGSRLLGGTLVEYCAQGRSPRLTCGFGIRSRRIWSERIRA
ncbi:hypothetical protein GCM10018793_15670 [Streptomyces sulfonofaciens]|uniref:Uncharacterized protein n=1 Tax=Streptomyces sulfonofaciens TaxID=68272 RepID=A0A919KW40_9ACTN|nr:hypothetical protein GCM10018793_15670 [Streptomyces sulfonofaciens]